MRTAFIIHGAYGSPEENWFPWLKKELDKLSYHVIVPQFPTPLNQTLAKWHEAFAPYVKDLKSDSIIVAHSLGVPFILSVLEKLPKPIKAAFFVAGFAEQLGIPGFDIINKTFTERTFDWDKIKANCQNFYLFNSENDSYVTYQLAENMAKNLGVEVNLVSGAGHFNQKSGYKEFNLLLKTIREANGD